MNTINSSIIELFVKTDKACWKQVNRTIVHLIANLFYVLLNA